MSIHHFNWQNNSVQFPRFISEAEAAGAFPPQVILWMAKYMGLETKEVIEILDRAKLEWKHIQEKDRLDQIETEKAEQLLRERQARFQAEELAYNRLVEKLKRTIKPGDLLKMRGCRDLHGLREFIRWNGDRLVCWQIIRVWNGTSWQNQTGTQVTEHMADKVSQVHVNGVPFPIKSILQ